MFKKFGRKKIEIKKFVISLINVFNKIKAENYKN